MFHRTSLQGLFLSAIVLTLLSPLAAQSTQPASGPAKIYVPYESLHKVLAGEKAGVFLPYEEFHKLWEAAQALLPPPRPLRCRTSSAPPVSRARSAANWRPCSWS